MTELGHTRDSLGQSCTLFSLQNGGLESYLFYALEFWWELDFLWLGVCFCAAVAVEGVALNSFKSGTAAVIG